MLWVCLECGAFYSEGADSCPQCGSQERQDKPSWDEARKENEMPKITVAGGASNAGDKPSEGQPEEISASGVDETTNEAQEEVQEGPEALDDTYELMTVAELKDELSERDLPQSGNKSDLINRLREDDRQQ
jgi:predicted  nucleic acid-binding Zn-ribbon protein